MTRRPRLAIQAIGAMTASMLLIPGLAGIAQAGALAPACVAVTGVQPPNLGGSNGDGLDGVVALSSCNAWAVGSYFNGTASQSLILHWNGSSWKVVQSPDPGGPSRDNVLAAVSAVSSSSVWAVGSSSSGTVGQTLVEHWNGSSWKVVPSPDPGGPAGDRFLDSVSATSSAGAWVAGSYSVGSAMRTLVLHCDRVACKVVASPNPGGRRGASVLTGVSAASPASAWAVGWYGIGSQHTLVLHWNGAAWKHVKSPDVSSEGNVLNAVTALSARDAWAAGSSSNGDTGQTLIERWNGSAWKVVPSPNPGGTVNSNGLNGISAISAASTWAVGTHGLGVEQTLVLHWNGKTWKQVPSPDPGGPSHDNVLVGVSATSPANVWMIGNYFSGLLRASQTLGLHCC